MQRGERSNFIVEKSDKCYLSQAVKFNINNEYHVDIMYHSYDAMKMALYLCSLLPQTYNPSLTTRKTSEKYQLRDILQNS